MVNDTRQSSMVDLEDLRMPNDKRTSYVNSNSNDLDDDRNENRLALVVSNEGPNPSINEEVGPDGGYGWVVLGALIAVNICTWGIISVSIIVVGCLFPES